LIWRNVIRPTPFKAPFSAFTVCPPVTQCKLCNTSCKGIWR